MAQGTQSRVPLLLEKKGWSAMELARRANIAHGTARRLKNGETDGFTLSTLQAVAEALDVHWLALFKEDKSG